MVKKNKDHYFDFWLKQYDMHDSDPFVRFMDLFSKVVGKLEDFIMFLTNKFIDIKIEKKYRRKYRNGNK